MKRVPAKPGHGPDRRCPCAACTQARRAEHAAHRAERRAQRVLIDGRWVAPLPAPYHGKLNAYREWSCRCPPCVQANSDAWRAYKARRRARDTPT